MIKDVELYLSHVEEDKKVDMRRILDLIEVVIQRHEIVSSDFLDPYTVELSMSILNRFDEIGYEVVGGFPNAERRVIVIYNDYVSHVDMDTIVTGIRIKLNTDVIQHKDVLGSILGLGIVRGKIGDINMGNGYADIVVSSTISDFILYNLEKVKRENIKLESISISELEEAEVEYSFKEATISSLRLDAYIGEAYNLSRQDSQMLIKSEKVKVNFKSIDKSSYPLDSGDLISIRGKGRSILSEIKGTSKKGRIRISIAFPK